MLLGCDGLCLSDLLKYFVIFLVASNSSAIWSGLLVKTESCKFGFSVLIYFVSVLPLLLLLKVLWPSCLLEWHFLGHLDGV